MKLVELLAKEMSDWPEDATHLTQSIVDTEVYNSIGDVCRGLTPRVDLSKRHTQDKSYPEVTKEQWQAERDRQKGAEWIRNRGKSKKAPVDIGTMVEVRFRNGLIEKDNGYPSWHHDGTEFDIMAFRVISQPQAEEVPMIAAGDTREYKGPFPCAPEGEPVTELEWDIQFQQGIFHMEAKTDQIDGPILWRDCVNELDAYIEEFTREREALINRLAEEGFALIPAMTAVMGVADVHVDLTYWGNWKAGDVVECTYSDCSNIYTVGKRYDVAYATSDYAKVSDDCGEDSFCHIADADKPNVRFKLIH
jgi:hypothetical protein